MQTFATIRNKTMCDMISHAKWRVIYVGPGISMDVAKSIIKFISKNGFEQVEVILDPNPEVCRLGYGEIEAMDLLFNKEVIVRKCNGIRIGVIVADDNAFIYTPTPLVVEEEPDVISPNAIAVEPEQAKQLVCSICPYQEEVVDKSPNAQ